MFIQKNLEKSFTVRMVKDRSRIQNSDTDPAKKCCKLILQKKGLIYELAVAIKI